MLGFGNCILGETGVGEGRGFKGAPTLVAGVDSYSAERWKEVGELDRRQDEHDRL